MKECYVTNRDIQTRFNPIFHALKIAHIKKEIEEMYHAGTTITNYDYNLGFMTTRSRSAEDVAIDILSKRERLDNRILRHERYVEIHETAIEEVWRHEEVILTYQRGAYTLDDVGQVFGLTRERVRQILDRYRRAVSALLTQDDKDGDPISREEIEQLSALVEASVSYEPKEPPKHPLHGMDEWRRQDNRKRRLRREARETLEAVI